MLMVNLLTIMCRGYFTVVFLENKDSSIVCMFTTYVGYFECADDLSNFDSHKHKPHMSVTLEWFRARMCVQMTLQSSIPSKA